MSPLLGTTRTSTGFFLDENGIEFSQPVSFTFSGAQRQAQARALRARNAMRSTSLQRFLPVLTQAIALVMRKEIVNTFFTEITSSEFLAVVGRHDDRVG